MPAFFRRCSTEQAVKQSVRNPQQRKAPVYPHFLVYEMRILHFRPCALRTKSQSIRDLQQGKATTMYPLLLSFGSPLGLLLRLLEAELEEEVLHRLVGLLRRDEHRRRAVAIQLEQVLRSRKEVRKRSAASACPTERMHTSAQLPVYVLFKLDNSAAELVRVRGSRFNLGESHNNACTQKSNSTT